MDRRTGEHAAFEGSGARGREGRPVSRTAKRYAEIWLTLERAGIRLSDPDLRIASIAAASERLLVTGNLKPFARVPGLRAEDWIH